MATAILDLSRLVTGSRLSRPHLGRTTESGGCRSLLPLRLRRLSQLRSRRQRLRALRAAVTMKIRDVDRFDSKVCSSGFPRGPNEPQKPSPPTAARNDPRSVSRPSWRRRLASYGRRLCYRRCYHSCCVLVAADNIATIATSVYPASGRASSERETPRFGANPSAANPRTAMVEGQTP